MIASGVFSYIFWLRNYGFRNTFPTPSATKSATATRVNAMFFTRYGATVFVASQAMSAVSATLFLLIYWGLLAIPSFGWIVGNERSDALLPTTLAAILVGILDAQGSAARPRGHGTGKWLFIDAAFSLLKVVPLLLGAFAFVLHLPPP